MYYTSAHSSLKSDLKFRTSLLPSVGSIFSQSKNGFPKYCFLNQKIVSQNIVFSIKKWFPKILFSQSKNGFPKYCFLNQKMVSQNIVFSIKKWFPKILFSQSKNAFHHIYKNIMIYMFFQTYESWVRLNYW